MTDTKGFGLLDGEGILGQLNIGGNGGGKEGVLGQNMTGKVKETITSRIDNTKRTAQELKDTIMGGSWRPFQIITAHIEKARNANQDLRPNIITK